MRRDGCSATLFRKQVDQNDKVCLECNHHFPVTAVERIKQLLDQDTYEDWFSNLQPADPLQFDDRRPYPERLKAEQKRTGLKEAAFVGQGFIKGIRIVFGITDSNFIMGSMGSVVGEKLTRAVEAATRQQLPLVIVSGSGGGAQNARRDLLPDADGRRSRRLWGVTVGRAACSSAYSPIPPWAGWRPVSHHWAISSSRNQRP